MWILILLAALLPGAFPALAQDSLAIRVNVGLVNVTFTARDASGKLVGDLTKDDIEILDDGATQSISFFARSEDLPLSLGLIADVSGSQEPFLKKHHHDLDEFLKRVLTEKDRAFLVCFGNHVRLVSDFSSKRERLIDSLKDFDGKQRNGPYPDLGPKERRILGTAFYDALYLATAHLSTAEQLVNDGPTDEKPLDESVDEKSVSEKVADQREAAPAGPARRALIVFSDGEDNSSAHHMLDAIEAAQSADAVIYGIRYTEIDKHGLNARNKYGTSVMNRIGRETGGRDFDAEKTDTKKAFAEIGEELRSSYELGYHSSNSDGTFHKLLIRAKRPGIVIRAKTGYFAREGS
jgi:Ca-activated chloride channel family protein